VHLADADVEAQPGQRGQPRPPHADVDNGDLHLDKVRQLGGWAVASGTTGNGHVYVPLKRSLSPEQFTVLESALKVHLGADSKIAANDVLRPVGTLNCKPTVLKPGSEPTAVAFLIAPDGSRMEPDAVAQILGIDLSAPATVSASNGSTTDGFAAWDPKEFNLADDRYQLVRQALAEVSSPLDRSEDTMRVVGRCYDAGLTLPQARWAVNTRADLAGRIDDRKDDDVLRSWLKIDQERRESGRLSMMVADTGQADGDEFEKNVRTELDRLRIKDEARRRFDAENRSAAEPFDAGLLEEVLDRSDTPQFRISGICPADGGMLIVAQRKTGKTTLTLNLARCLLTGEPFLGGYGVNEKVAGRVGLLNYEVSGSQLARWADDVGVPQDRLLLVNLRGRRNPLGDAEDRERLVELLRENEVESLIVDPFGRAFTGNSQNDSGEVGTWLQDLDLFARGEVGARDVILTAHAGWTANERARGSSALEDWADSVVTLTTNPDRRRFIKALGRDVDIDEDELNYNPDTRLLAVSGTGGRAQADHRSKVDDLVHSVCAYLKDNPGSSTKGVVEGVTGRNADIREALTTAVELGLITKAGEGAGNAVRHWLAGGGPE